MGEHTENALDEPTMGEKLKILDNDNAIDLQEHVPPPSAKPPSTDSIHILLKQALHVDDRALLLDCLRTQDEIVIENSTLLLDMPAVYKLLKFILSILHSRGAVVISILPWLRCLLLHHSSGILSQESSLQTLNSLKQLIESRVSTYKLSCQVSSYVDLLFQGDVDDNEIDENGAITPIIFEDNDDDDDNESSEDAMDADRESEVIEATSNMEE